MEELTEKWFRGAGSKGCFKPTRNKQEGLGQLFNAFHMLIRY